MKKEKIVVYLASDGKRFVSEGVFFYLEGEVGELLNKAYGLMKEEAGHVPEGASVVIEREGCFLRYAFEGGSFVLKNKEYLLLTGCEELLKKVEERVEV